MQRTRTLAAFVVMSTWTISGFADMTSADIIAAPRGDVVQARVGEFVHARNITDEMKLAEIEALWKASATTVSGEAMLDRVLQSFAAVHPPTAEILPQLTFPAASMGVPDTRELLGQKELGAFYQSNFRVYLGKYLVQ